MRNIYLIARVQMAGQLRFLRRTPGKSRARGIFILIGVALLALLMMGYSAGLAWVLITAGFGRVVPGLMLMIASLLSLVTTVLKSGGMLLNCRDYDMVASLPVRAIEHVLSRLLSMYLVEFAFCFIAMAPAYVTCAVFMGAGALVPLVPAIFIAPLIPMAIGVALGVGINWISARFRHGNFVAIVLSMAVVMGLMYLSMSAQSMDASALMQIGRALENIVERTYPPARALTQALDGNAMPMVWFFLCSVAAFGLLAQGLARVYGVINSSVSARHARGGYRVRTLRARAPLSALYSREIKRIFALPMFAMNVLVGPLILLGASVVALVGGAQVRMAVSLIGIEDVVINVAALFAAMCTTLAPASCCALSLDGRHRWIAYAAPVSAKSILDAKMLSSLTLQVPVALVGGAMLAVGLGAGVSGALLAVFVILAWSLLSSVAGMALNLKFPRYDWANEQEIIKRGAPMTLSMLLSMGSVVATGALVIWQRALGVWIVLGASVVCVAVSVVIYARIVKAKLYL